MKNIIKASVVLGAGTFISLIVGVIRKKLLAVYLGAHGLGVYAQVFNYFTVAGVIAAFGLSQAITTYIAKNNNIPSGDKAIAEVLKVALSILLFFSLLMLFLSILFSKKISALALDDRSLYYLIIICAFGIPFQVLGQGLLSFLQGFKNSKNITAANIGISLLGLIGTVPLVIYYGIQGAIVSVLFLAVITFFFSLSLPGSKCSTNISWKYSIYDPR
jgi:O-antigen/teichoic acid export membrane protein